ncbi:HAD-IA family hydrolase [Bacillus albus]|uniref:HAD family hydrolase n=1 Tax=Bacillus cereus group TaxID=86661 RepID=UPI0022DFBC8A|nr:MULTISPECIES: HAD family hydrolase [Bacillus cereus group]MDA2025854.1 HAD-IA family hydrolase [Bacillus cereus group sp. Bcc03]MDA2215632.1 HAD-IA family hydrolase [Bacillus cereus group sp. Bc228]MDA2225992.1 HAD-IA family hydrolase [Bacillus cereus group sp. Bc227]MDA2259960.1 HAD-IA family hydrolase [Bacillus cereus group sp. Bc200]MDA2320394.1 HAD-IA family hydrolase [Bacillus cereus group sp. Bc177]
MSYKAMLFDLDDTLLDRDKAVDNFFLLVLEKCYEDVSDTVKNTMLQKFKEYDKREYGISDKTIVLDSLFDEFAPKYRLPHNYIQDFWNENFPKCFSIDQNTIHFLNQIKKQFKVGVITNGSTQRQKAKIFNTNLNKYFETIIISEEVGFSKPDKRIFELALNKLNVQPENTLFIGDDLEKDIAGPQNVNIKGVWFNPQKIKNTTQIQPYAEINTLDSLLSYVTPQYFYNK